MSGISVGLVLVGGGFAAAGTRIWDGGGAAGPISVTYYQTADLQADISVITAKGESPVEACAAVARGRHEAGRAHRAAAGELPAARAPASGSACATYGLDQVDKVVEMTGIKNP